MTTLSGLTRCVSTSFDENYLEYACVMLQSLADNYRKEIDVICMVPPHMVTDEYENKITSAIEADHFSIKLRSSEKYQELVTSRDWEKVANPHASNAALLKVFIGSLCEEYDISAYIDPDCLVRKEATNFIEHELYGKKIVAYPEHGEGADRDLKMPERAYFNNGVFVIDLNYWRVASLEDKIVDWLLKTETGPLVEQTAMNYFLYEEWFPMSPNFNYRDSKLFEHHLYYNDPTIVHFLGQVKPWTPDETFDEYRGRWEKDWIRTYARVWGLDSFWRKPYRVPAKKPANS